MEKDDPNKEEKRESLEDLLFTLSLTTDIPFTKLTDLYKYFRRQWRHLNGQEDIEDPDPAYEEWQKRFSEPPLSLLFYFHPIPAGEFIMGSDRGEDNEKPAHLVKISEKFEISQYLVTQAEWQKLMEHNPSQFIGNDLPVEHVTWFEAQEYIDRLNCQSSKFQYRLPTEAEWEYACRAGGDDGIYEIINDYAWHRENSDYKTHPVGTKFSGGHLLYDMLGNVWEWCQDWFQIDYYQHSPHIDPTGPENGQHRVVRGGSFSCSGKSSSYPDPDRDYESLTDCRPTSRSCYQPDDRSDIGFRLVRMAKERGLATEDTE